MLQKILLRIFSLVGFRRLIPLLSWKFPGNPIFYLKSKNLSLTIDDGPSKFPLINDSLYELLQSYNIKATFFIISNNITSSNSSFIRKLVENGHELANHMPDDISYNKYSASEFENSLLQCENKLLEFDPQFNNKKKLFRPPYGKLSKTMIPILMKHNYITILGDLYSFDFHIKRQTDLHANYFINNAKEGSIIIVHLKEEICEILNKSLPILIKKGFEFRRVSDSRGII